MSLRTRCSRLLGVFGLLLLSGCCSPMAEELSRPLDIRSSRDIDIDAGRFQLPPNATYLTKPATPDLAADAGKAAAPVDAAEITPAAATDAGGVVPAAALQPIPEGPQPKKVSQIEKYLIMPPVLPGAATPDLKLPPAGPERVAALKKFFPPLPPLMPVALGVPGPDGRPLTLADLQKIAAEKSPLLRLAVADIESARGKALQVGLPPNLTFAYEGDAANQNASAGIQGAYISQVIKTMGKLRLAQEAAFFDIRMKEQSLRKAQAEVQKQVRQYYFSYLWARENVQVANGVARLTDNLFNVLLQMTLTGITPPYQTMQLRVVALQTRGLVIQAQNRHIAAWQQLAAALSQPTMPLSQVAGQIDRPVPVFRYEEVLARVFAQHSDILNARLLVLQAQKSLQLAQVQPIPDVDVRVLVQKDFTTPPYHAITSVVVGGPLPIWDRNQGNILQAQAAGPGVPGGAAGAQRPGHPAGERLRALQQQPPVAGAVPRRCAAESGAGVPRFGPGLPRLR